MTALPRAGRYILVLGLVFLADPVLFHAVNYMELLIRDRIEYNGGDYLLKRCGEIRYQYYEDGEIYRKIQKIMSTIRMQSGEGCSSGKTQELLHGFVL